MLQWLLLLFGFTTIYLSFGAVCARLTQIRFSPLETLLFSAALSITIIPSSIVLLGHLVGATAYWLLAVYGLIGLSYSRPFLETLKLLYPRQLIGWVKVLAVIISVAVVGSMQYLSGMQTKEGVWFQEIHDTMWHVALGEQVAQAFPPAHPSLPSFPLENYHYFYDVFLATLHKISGVSFLALNYQFSPVIVLLVLFTAAYTLGRRLHSAAAGMVLVFLTAFGGSFAYMIPWFLSGQSWSESSFWVSQTFAMLVNPQILFSLTVVYAFALLQLPPFVAQWRRHLILLPLLACSIGFKSYGWMVLSLLYAVDLLWEVIQKRSVSSIGIGILYVVISAPFVWLITHFQTGTFFYQPLWFIDTMIEAPDRVNNLTWKFMEDHYRAHQNWPRVIEIKAKEIAVFFTGNLGTRTLFLVLLPLILLRKVLPTAVIRLTALSLLGFLFASIFPHLFLQTGTVWNSIQFWYYALIFANILTVITLIAILKNQPRWVLSTVALIIVAASLPTFFKTLIDKWQVKAVVERSQIEFLTQLQPSEKILICPENTVLYQSALVAALSPAQVLISGPAQLALVSADTLADVNLSELFRRREAGSLRAFVASAEASTIICSDEDMNEFITQEFAGNTQAVKSQHADWHIVTLKYP